MLCILYIILYIYIQPKINLKVQIIGILEEINSGLYWPIMQLLKMWQNPKEEQFFLRILSLIAHLNLLKVIASTSSNVIAQVNYKCKTMAVTYKDDCSLVSKVGNTTLLCLKNQFQVLPNCSPKKSKCLKGVMISIPTNSGCLVSWTLRQLCY